MNIQEQKQFKLSVLWLVLKPVLSAIIGLLGEEAIEWLRGKIDELKDDETQERTRPCDGPKPTTQPTPYGEWRCNTSTGSWEWIEDIG